MIIRQWFRNGNGVRPMTPRGKVCATAGRQRRLLTSSLNRLPSPTKTESQFPLVREGKKREEEEIQK